MARHLLHRGHFGHESDAEQRLYAIVSTITGLLSLTGSTLLISTILQSKKKLSVPYRRIIFGISVFDIFQSASFVASSVPTPCSTTPFSHGTTTTCDIQGFFLNVGFCGITFYLCSLCIYYFCIVRLNMKRHAFGRIEPILHIVPILYSFSVGGYALTKEYYNSSDWAVCSLAAIPDDCEILPGVECKRGEGAFRFMMLFLGIPTAIIFLTICGCMAAIVNTAKQLEKRNERYSIGPSVSDTDRDSSRVTSTKSAMFSLRSEDESTIIPSSSHHRLRKTWSRTSSKTRETKRQAFLYVGSFLLAYGTCAPASFYNHYSTHHSVILDLLLLTFLPLQGFVNMFIYCRPHIVSLRTRYPGEYTWFQAFRIVLKSGGDSCRVTVAAERRQQERNHDNALLVDDDDFPGEQEIAAEQQQQQQKVDPTTTMEEQLMAIDDDDVQSTIDFTGDTNEEHLTIDIVHPSIEHQETNVVEENGGASWKRMISWMQYSTQSSVANDDSCAITDTKLDTIRDAESGSSSDNSSVSEDEGNERNMLPTHTTSLSADP